MEKLSRKELETENAGLKKRLNDWHKLYFELAQQYRKLRDQSIVSFLIRLGVIKE